MNRGYEGRPIFKTHADKAFFLELLKKVVGLMKIRILAYCVIDNHYHMIVQNMSGRMSDFFKQLNGQYAIHYRKVHGGRGYVFQDRFKTMLIQDDEFLPKALELSERRSGRESVERRRCQDMYFDPCEKVLAEFERMKSVQIGDIDVTDYHGKRLRCELLVLLKENAGMTYR